MVATAYPLGSGSLVSGTVRITGQYRLPSDIVSELKHVLAENPQIVILDLHAAAGNGRAVRDVLDPVASYLASWPGTILAICVPDPAAAARVLPAELVDHVLLDRTPVEALERARRRIEHQDRAAIFLTPKPQAAEDARVFTRRSLREWRLDDLIWPASLTVNELVTHSILQSETVLDLTLGRLGRQVRIAVHDYGTDQLRIAKIDEAADPLEEDLLLHRGFLVVRAMTRCWGVFPSRVHGKTVWAVMDSHGASAA